MCEYVHARPSPSSKECIIQISLESRVYKTLPCSACSLSKLSYRPLKARERERESNGVHQDRRELRDNRMQPRPRGGGGCDCAIITGTDLSVCWCPKLLRPSSSSQSGASSSSRPPPDVPVLSFIAPHSPQQRLLIAPLTVISAACTGPQQSELIWAVFC